jgi:hypothetical protein
VFCIDYYFCFTYALEDFISFSFRTSITSKEGKTSTKCTSKGTPSKGNLGFYLFIFCQGVLKECVYHQGNKLTEELLKKHGDAVNKGMQV